MRLQQFRYITVGAITVFCLLGRCIGDPPLTAQVAPVKPQYWVAVLSVGMSDSDIQSLLLPYVQGFCGDIAREFGPDDPKPRCFFSMMKTHVENACIVPNRKDMKMVPNCEALEVYWNKGLSPDGKAGMNLKLVVKEPGPNGLDDSPPGEIFTHWCPLQDKFADCFDKQRVKMAKQVADHDRMCHGGCKCIATKDNRLACPGQ